MNFHQMGLSLESGEPSDGHVYTCVFQPCPAVRSREVHVVHQEQHHLPQIQGVQVRRGFGGWLLVSSSSCVPQEETMGLAGWV